jgi:2,4-dienoyl-CoA reductase-like NADH-dependent reductase (Old Yellow Enzyme family)
MDKKYEQLFEPFTFKSGVTVDNRLFMAPMTTNAAFENGMFTTDEHHYYERRGGGVGAIVTSCAHVQENGKFAASPSVSSDNRIESLSKLAKKIQATGSKAILQIFHVGRMGSRQTLRGETPVSASEVPALRENAEIPRQLSEEEVEEMVKSFGEATRRAIEAGFDGVELHGANTYLIQQFFSPHSNVRTDYWGGSLEKRMNFPIEVVAAAKRAIDKYADKPFIFGYRISPEEIENPGITISDTIRLLNELKIYDLDYFHISTGNIFTSSLRDEEDKEYVVKQLQEAVGDDVPLIGVGNVITPDDATQAMDELGIPLIALGRELIIEPDWVKKVKNGEEKDLRKVIEADKREDLMIPDAMWEYINNRPGWLPIVN